MALTDEIYRWVSSMKCAHISKNPNRIHFYHQTRKGTIAFYEGYILELSVEDCQSGQCPFYIHFAIQGKEQAKGNIRLFFQALEGKGAGQEALDRCAVRRMKPLKILVSCSCGITSSYFALLMQESLNQAGAKITADAVGNTGVEEVGSRYDYILLAPQIGHMLPEFQEKYGDKVLAIDFMDFASRNVNHVLNLIAQKAGTAA